MYSNFTKCFTALTLVVLLTMFSQILLAQTKVTGELTLAETARSPVGSFVTVNGERAETGRTIVSPAEIVTPANINAKVAIANVGSATLAPNSTVNLRFESGSISGILVSGDFIIYANPNVAVDLATPDGKISVAASSKLNSFEVKIVNGKSTVYSILGSTEFNGKSIAAGEYYPSRPKDSAPATTKKSGGSGGLIIAAIIGTIGGGILLAVASSSGGSNSTVSPVR